MIEASPLPLVGAVVKEAEPTDAAELLVLQRCCWVSEAIVNDTLDIPALHETLETVQEWVRTKRVWVVRVDDRLVAAVRGHSDGRRWEIGRLMVAPDRAGQGLGRWLLHFAERQAPPGSVAIDLFTGAGSTRNLRMYQQAGYHMARAPADRTQQHIRDAVHLTKAPHRRARRDASATPPPTPGE